MFRETFYSDERCDIFCDAEKINGRWERTFYKWEEGKETPTPLDFNPHTGGERLPLTNTNVSKMGHEVFGIQGLIIVPSLVFYQDMKNEHGKDAAVAIAARLQKELLEADLNDFLDKLN